MSIGSYRYVAQGCSFPKLKANAPGNFTRKRFPTRKVAVMGALQNTEQNMPNQNLQVGVAGRSQVCDNKTLCTIGAKHYSSYRLLPKINGQAGLAERELLSSFRISLWPRDEWGFARVFHGAATLFVNKTKTVYNGLL